MWVGTEAGRLYRRGRGDFTAVTSSLGPVRAIERDRSGNLWITTFNGGLVRYNRGGFSTLGVDKLPHTDLSTLLEALAALDLSQP